MHEVHPKAYRRVVTGNGGDKAVMLSDAQLATFPFKAIPGFEHILWTDDAAHDGDPAKVDAALPRSALVPIANPKR